MKCDRVNWLKILCCIHNNEILVLANSYEFRTDQRTTSTSTVCFVQSVIYALN